MLRLPRADGVRAVSGSGGWDRSALAGGGALGAGALRAQVARGVDAGAVAAGPGRLERVAPDQLQVRQGRLLLAQLLGGVAAERAGHAHLAAAIRAGAGEAQQPPWVVRLVAVRPADQHAPVAGV